LIIPLLLFAAVCGISRRELAIGLIAVGIAIGVVQLVRITYPILDRTVSPRQFWQSQAKQVTCVPSSQRSWRYGLSYYAGRNLPDCN
jgi:hypothetical protein